MRRGKNKVELAEEKRRVGVVFYSLSDKKHMNCLLQGSSLEMKKSLRKLAWN